MNNRFSPLPIDAHIPEILDALRHSKSLVLTAPPGAGKTTRIPRALYEAGFAHNGEILILEPRRLAARMAAARVAEEFGEKLGETVGYSIRFENVSGPNTRIRFLTEAILARRMTYDHSLAGISVVILDEFHERHLSTDLALALLRRLQANNSEIKLVVMSATMDAGSVASFLDGSRVIALSGSPFTIQIEHEEKPDARLLHEKVLSAVLKIIRSGARGDILVFLPGAADIRRSSKALAPFSQSLDFELFALHGELPSADQKRAIEPSQIRKIILSTNVAETSITIPGIAAVVDSGLAKIAGHSSWSGFPTIATAKISKSSAIQRAGRAGRTQAGLVTRLYSKYDFESRPEHEVPEIKRADLTETALMLHGAEIHDLINFPWFEAPSALAIEAAESLLHTLGAINKRGEITNIGRRMLAFPVHPRLARMIVESENMNVAEDVILLSALMSERDIRFRSRADFSQQNATAKNSRPGSSDLIELLDCYREAESAGFSEDRLRSLELDYRAVQAVRRASRQLERIQKRKRTKDVSARAQNDEALHISVLAAFPDRVAKRRKPGSQELLLSGGGSAFLSDTSAAHSPIFLVAVDVEERKNKVSADMPGTIVRLTSAVEIEWIAGLFPDAVTESIALIWNDRAERVDEAKRVNYGQIALEETIAPAPPSDEASRMLAAEVLRKGIENIWDLSFLSDIKERIAIAASHFPEEDFPSFENERSRALIESMCTGKRSMTEVASMSPIDAFLSGLSYKQRVLLERELPEKIRLKAGRTVTVHYEPGKPPWIQSRLQDFFGMKQTPKICAGRVPLTVHLLAPNNRAVQVTQDLAGFWERHYPSIRKELQRRYPKHKWPSPEEIK